MGAKVRFETALAANRSLQRKPRMNAKRREWLSRKAASGLKDSRLCPNGTPSQSPGLRPLKRSEGGATLGKVCFQNTPQGLRPTQELLCPSRSPRFICT